MKKRADAGRQVCDLQVGDKVLVKLQKYCQQSAARRLSHKLERCYFGPFVITEKTGEVAFRLQLPDDAKIHNVFHASLLKKFIPGDAPSVPQFPTDLVQSEEELGAKRDGVDTSPPSPTTPRLQPSIGPRIQLRRTSNRSICLC